MLFRDIIGQERVKQQLLTQAHTGRVAHAQMFTGIGGVGKLKLALAFAQYLACENPSETDSCGQCAQCLQMQRLEHPDLHFAFPIYKKESSSSHVWVCDDYLGDFKKIILEKGYFSQTDWNEQIGATQKQTLIYEAESDEILRKLSLKPFYDGYKTLILWLPEKMNVQCQNKLLKLIEEPPVKTHLLFVSEKQDTILPTILSRVQQISVPTLQEDNIATYLRNAMPYLSVEQSFEYAHLAHGSICEAVRIARNEQDTNEPAFLTAFYDLFANALKLKRGKEPFESINNLRKWADDWAKEGRETLKELLQYIQNQLRENYIASFAEPEINYQTNREKEKLNILQPYFKTSNILKLMNILSLAQQHIEQNGNARIVLFDMTLKITKDI
ncbi:MAG: DNA polymerase III subunit delta [Paludibacteraceae bacterium]|nr:DNA polymerase III subunit delta [Paludibacteraceae bacterium]